MGIVLLGLEAFSQRFSVSENGHGCVVRSDGKLSCIGKNNYGQLGLGHANDFIPRSIPYSRLGDTDNVPIADFTALSDPSLTTVDLGDEIATKVACYESQTCVALKSKKVVCFGQNSKFSDRLGINVPSVDTVGTHPSDMGSNLRPVTSVPTISPIIDLGYFSAFTEDGSFYAWGDKKSLSLSCTSQKCFNGRIIPSTALQKEYPLSSAVFLIGSVVSDSLNTSQLLLGSTSRESSTPPQFQQELQINDPFSTWTYATFTNDSIVKFESLKGEERVLIMTSLGNVYQIDSEKNWNALGSGKDISGSCYLKKSGQEITCISITLVAFNPFYPSSTKANRTYSLPVGTTALSIHVLTPASYLPFQICAILNDGNYWCTVEYDPSNRPAAFVLGFVLVLLFLGGIGFLCYRRLRNGRIGRFLFSKRILYQKKKKYAVFISHHKKSSAEVANSLWSFFNVELGVDSFLDTSHLTTITDIREGVKCSLVLVACQTEDYLYRPWCLVELYQALLSDVPIVPINIENQGYNFEESMAFLRSRDFRKALDERNPGAVEELERHGINVVDLALRISNSLPYLVSKPYNSYASNDVRKAQLSNILKLVMDRMASRFSNEIVAVVDEPAVVADEEQPRSLKKSLSHHGNTKQILSTINSKDEDELVRLIQRETKQILDEKMAEMETRLVTRLQDLLSQKI
jgi:hypothetical protein